MTATWVVISGILALLFSYEKMQQILKNSHNFGSRLGKGVATEEFQALLGEGVLEVVVVSILLPFIVGLVVEMLQVGWLFELSLLRVQLNRLDPFAGLRRLLGYHDEFSFVRSPFFEFIKLTLLLGIMVLVIAFSAWSLVRLDEVIAPTAMGYFLMPLFFASLGWSVLCLLLTRHSRSRRLFMTLEELKDELRDSEGRHEIKQHRQALHAALPAALGRPKLIITGGGR